MQKGDIDLIRISGIINESIVDGPGIRLVIFAQGCLHNCDDCHNPETHSFTGGKLVKIKDIIEKIKENPLLDGVTFSGGDPFEQAEEFVTLGKEIKKLGLSIITYTGYKYEDIKKSKDKNKVELLNVTDILIDGPFEKNKRSIGLKFRGSSNQRIIDVTKENAIEL